MSPAQTNTKEGIVPFLANADLTGKEGYLAKVVNNSGSNEAALPAALTDVPLYVIEHGDVAAKPVDLRPLVPGRNTRLKLKGTCVAGDKLVLADPATPADAGKVRKLPATAGVYVQVGIAEETGADGQLALARPQVEIIRVKSADSLTALTFSAQATQAEAQALRNALLAILQAQGLVA